MSTSSLAAVLDALAGLRRVYADDLDADRLALDGRPQLRALLAAYDQWLQDSVRTHPREMGANVADLARGLAWSPDSPVIMPYLREGRDA